MADDLSSVLSALVDKLNNLADNVRRKREAGPTSPRTSGRSEELRDKEIAFANEQSKSAALLKEQNNLYSILNKTLSSYNKGLMGGLAGLMRAEVTRRRINNQERHELNLLQKRIQLKEKEIEELEGTAKLRAEMKLVELKNREAVLKATQGLEGASEGLAMTANALKSMVDTIRETQQQFGITAADAAKLQFTNLAASIQSFGQSILSLGKAAPVTTAQIQQAQADFQEEFGGVLTSDAAKSLAEEATRLGITTVQMAKARRAFMTISMGDVSKAKAETDRFINEFKRKGLTATDAMKAIAENSDLLARNGTRFATAFARAAADAKKIGVEISKVDQFADSIIDDFEGYLERQAELGAMGIGFDSSRLAEVALTGDTAAFQQELRTQLAALGPELMNLDRAQQLSLQQMSGMTMAELQRLAGVVEGSGEQTLPIEEQNNSILNNIVNLVQSLVVPLMGGMSILLSIIAANTAATALSSATGLTGVAGLLTRFIPMLGTVMGALIPILGIIAGVAVLGIAGYGIYKSFKTGNDVVSKPGYGKRMLLTETGIISLNNQDNIVAYADDMTVNDDGVSRYPKGSLSPKKNISNLNTENEEPWKRLYGMQWNGKYKRPFNVIHPDNWSIMDFGRGAPYKQEQVPDTYVDPRHLHPEVVKRMKYKKQSYDGMPLYVVNNDLGIGAVENYPGQYEEFKVRGQSFTRIEPQFTDPKEEEAAIKRVLNFATMIRAAGRVNSEAAKFLQDPEVKFFMEGVVDRRSEPFTQADLTKEQLQELNQIVSEHLKIHPFNEAGQSSISFNNKTSWGSTLGRATIVRNEDGTISIKDTYDFNNYERFLLMTSYNTEAFNNPVYPDPLTNVTNALLNPHTQDVLKKSQGIGELGSAIVGAAGGFALAGIPGAVAGAVGTGTTGTIGTTAAMSKLLIDKGYLNLQTLRSTIKNTGIIQDFAWLGRRALPSGIRGVGVDINLPATKFHNGGIAGSTDEIPAILQKGEAVLTQPQYQRVEELANTVTLLGADGVEPEQEPLPSPNVNVDLSQLEQAMSQLIGTVSGMRINLDGNRMSRILNTTGQAAVRIGVLDQQNPTITNR